MTFVDFPKCAGLYTLTEAVENIIFLNSILVVEYLIFIMKENSNFIVRFLMRARMLVQVT